MRSVSYLSLGLILYLSNLTILLVSGHFDPHPLDKIQIENIKFTPKHVQQGTITIETPIFNGTGEFVNVRWENLPSPYPGNFDWIGCYSPKPADYTKTTPAKYKYVMSVNTRTTHITANRLQSMDVLRVFFRPSVSHLLLPVWLLLALSL